MEWSSWNYFGSDVNGNAGNDLRNLGKETIHTITIKEVIVVGNAATADVAMLRLSPKAFFCMLALQNRLFDRSLRYRNFKILLYANYQYQMG